MGLRELFAPLLGRWTGREHQYASAWAAAADTRAMITFLVDVADQVVLQDYRQVRDDRVEFTAHGVFMALRQAQGASAAEDASAAEGAVAQAATGPGASIRWWLFDSYGWPPEPAEGVWCGAELSLEKATPRGSAQHRFGVVDDELRYEIDVRLLGEPEAQPFLRGRYRRISGH